MLPPKQRIKLYQPRSKLEQFEDILIESQLLEQAMADLAGSPLDYDKFEMEGLGLTREGMEGLGLTGITDFDTSDAIFAEPGADDRPEAERGEAEEGCRCESCLERGQLVAEMAEETKRLQTCWLELREDFKTVYRLVLEEAWGDSNRPKPNLEMMTKSVHKLVWRDPHQLYQRLESQLRDFVMELRMRLVDLLQKQAKNPNLAQEFIQSLLGGHDKLCEAGKLVAPVLSDLEVNHLRRFSLTWELLSKHMYQTLVYCDPLIQNNLPIFISQLRALYPNKENEDKYTELVRGYLDFDVEMENVGVFWSGAEALLLEYSQEQQRLREKQKMLKNDWERFKQQRKEIESSLMEKPQAGGGGEALATLGESLHQLLTGLEEVGVDALPTSMEHEMRREEVAEHVPGEDHMDNGAASTPASCECHVCTAPLPTSKQDSSLPLFPPKCSTPSPCPSSLYPHLYLPSSSAPLPSVVSSVASLSAALSSALQLTTSQASTTVSSSSLSSTLPTSLSLSSTTGAFSSNSSLPSSPSATSLAQRATDVADSLPSVDTTSLPTNASDPKKLENDGIRVTTDKSDGIRVTSNTSDGIRA